MKCRYCQNSSLKNYMVKEMRNGTREEFNYIFCEECEHLSLERIPSDLSKYYSDYYTKDKKINRLSSIRSLAWKVRSFMSIKINYQLTSKISKNTTLDWAHFCELTFQSKILDVGCGNGDILFEFQKHGFRDLEGLDLFPPNNIDLSGIRISKGDIFSLKNQKYDLIMFNHSFEHMNDHFEVLEKTVNHLNENGCILIRMPILNEAFYRYGSNWVQIDAPRHLNIHSIRSFEKLLSSLDLFSNKIFFDSTAFQFLGSEQNKANISFFEENSYKININRSIFTKDDLERFDREAAILNQNKKGDQAGFVIKRK